jgi:hypothetical protein
MLRSEGKFCLLVALRLTAPFLMQNGGVRPDFFVFVYRNMSMAFI